MRSAVFLQARLSSTRLPAKVIMEIGGEPLVVHCMRALRELPAHTYVLLCDEESEPVLRPFAARQGFFTFAGPKEDVLRRFVLAAAFFGVDYIWRGTSDNPLVSGLFSRQIIQAFLDNHADYAVMRHIPSGSCIEAVRTAALRALSLTSRDPYEREHVCPGIYNRPQLHKLVYLDPPPAYRRPDLNFSVDTIDDYHRMRRIFSFRTKLNRPIHIQDAISWASL